MIVCKIATFLFIFLFGEIVFNFTLIAYVKNYFSKSVEAQEAAGTGQKKSEAEKFLGFNISIFKGILERFLISICLISNILTILIVFGALKLGTRITDKTGIKNDYFLIGNLFSILIAVLYYHIFKWVYPYISGFA